MRQIESIRLAFGSAWAALAGFVLAAGLLLLAVLARLPAPVAFLAPLSVLLLICLAASAQGVAYSLGALIITITVQRERLGLPFETDLLGVVLLAALLAVRVPGREMPRRWPPFAWVGAAYVLVNLLATFWNAPDLRVSLRQSLILGYRLLMFILAALAIQWDPARRAQPARLLIGLMVAQAVLSLGAMLIYRVWPTPLVLYGKDGNAAIALNGFFQEPNLFGIFCLCMIALALPSLFINDGASRLPLIGALALGLAGVVLSYTRSTWLGLGLVVATLAAVIGLAGDRDIRRRFIRIGLTTLLALIVGAAIVIALFDREGFVASRLADLVNTKTSSSSGRLITWSAAVERWQANPLIGGGPLSFGEGPHTTKGWLYGSMIQALHDSGIAGLLLMLWFCGGCAAYTLRGALRAANQRDRAILLGFFLAQVGLFFTAQFSSLFWDGFTWVLLGLAVGHARLVLDPAGSGPAQDAAPAAAQDRKHGRYQ